MDNTTCLVAIELAKNFMTPEQHAQYVKTMRIAYLKNKINSMSMELYELEIARHKVQPVAIHKQIKDRIETLLCDKVVVAEKLAALN